MQEALCIMCRRIAYPSRLGDLQQFFGRSRTSISVVFNELTELFVDRYKKILFLDEVRIADSLTSYAGAIRRKDCPLNKVVKIYFFLVPFFLLLTSFLLVIQVWGFIDGTVRPCARPIY